MEKKNEISFIKNSPNIFFEFNSVVVVGASDNSTRIGGIPIFLLKKYGFKGKIYGLNPKYTTTLGIQCFSDVKKLPNKIDVAIFCVSADKIQEILPKLKEKGLKGLVIFSAGFTESGSLGKKLQNWLTEYSRSNQIAVLGPNCVGQISFASGRALTFANAFINMPILTEGRVALLSQSGGVATNIWADAVLNGTRFSHMITTGNEADLEFDDYLSYLADDDKTDFVIGYIEGLRDGIKFSLAANRMREKGKPLILIKVGTSAAGRNAVASHTGQLSSDDAGYQAAFDRFGVIRVKTLEELSDFSRVFSFDKLIPKVTIATTSGGAGVYATDLCTDLEIEMSNLSKKTENKLSKIIPSFGRIQNPVDLTAQVINNMSILTNSLSILLDDPECGILLFLLSGKGTLEQSSEVINVINTVQNKSNKKIILCWLGVSDEVRKRGNASGLNVYQDPVNFLRPLQQYFNFTNLSIKKIINKNNSIQTEITRDLNLIQRKLNESIKIKKYFKKDTNGNLMLEEKMCMDLLEEYGVDCPKRYFANSISKIVEISKVIKFPCVMKIVKPIITHKSDLGGVIIGITSKEVLKKEWIRLTTELKATQVMVVEQIEEGIELLVGSIRDETFGLRVTIASGGIWTNLLNSSITLIPPFNESYILSSIQKLPIWKQMSGMRGQQKYALDALIISLLNILQLMWDLRHDLKEFECNPIIINKNRAVVVDAIGFV
ncbi:MAG: acetate--CoA ligase family protein [Betaproteobacteria bacterium]